MKPIVIFILILSVTPDACFTQDVIINGHTLSADDKSLFNQTYGVEPVPGKYWYDSRSGIFGVLGGPAAGIMFPGHQFGQLKTDVSKGRSGVYVNGRQLQYLEAQYLAQLFGYARAVPGRYWLESNGNMGIEGHNVALGNIYAAMAYNARSSSRGDNFWSKGLFSGGNYYTGAGGQPSIGYVSVPGYGPVSHGIH